MVDRRSARQRAIDAHKVPGVHRELVRIPLAELREINATLPTGISLLPNGKYQARYRGDKKQQVTKTFTTLADAERWRTKGLADVAAHDWSDPRAGRQTLGSFYTTYRRAKRNLKASSQADIDYLWHEHVSAWADHQVGGIRTGDIERWVDDLAEQYSRSVVRRCVLILSGVLDEAVHQNAISKSPVIMARLKKRYPPLSKHHPNPLTREQVDVLLEYSSPAFRDLTQAVCLTGMRMSEACEVRAKDVHLSGISPRGVNYRTAPTLSLDRACVFVEERDETGAVIRDEVEGRIRIRYREVVDTPKSGRREVPLTPAAVELFRRLIRGKQPDALLFTSSTGDRLSRRGFATSLGDAADRAGLQTTAGQKITPHSLRDTYASHALAAGASLKALQRALGHATAAMTLDRYVGLLSDDVDAMREAMAEAERAHLERASRKGSKKAAPPRAAKRQRR